MRKIKERVENCCNRIWQWMKGNICVPLLIICVVGLIICLVKKGFLEVKFDHVIETFKISVTVLISMLGFSVSIYVFLNNALQTRKNNLVVEKETIEHFQLLKRAKLNHRIVFAVAAVIIECITITLVEPIEKYVLTQPAIDWKMACFVIIILCITVTIGNIISLGWFTYEVINYEKGLNELAVRERENYRENGSDDSVSKGEFLNIANNLEVLAERLIENHLHAKSSDSDESNLKRAICDGETRPDVICRRGEFAESYKNVMVYRNLLLQDHKLKDSDKVHMGDKVQSILNELFERYLSNELMTGVSISNICVTDADLSKTSFSSSFLQNITFDGEAVLNNTDFRNSTLNDIDFGKASCDSINFNNSKLINVRFNTNMVLQRAIFTEADLTGLGQLGPVDKEGEPLNLTNTNFDRANMTHLDIYNTSFDFASMCHVRLVDSKIGASAQKDANATFIHADMTHADMLRCVVERSDFSNADLDNAILTYSTFKNVDMLECRLQEASMSKSVLEDCKFHKSYASNISLKGTKVRRCHFPYATMVNTDMSGATFDHVDFEDSACKGSLWVGSTLLDCNFERCMLSNAKIAGEITNLSRIHRCSFKYANFSESSITNAEFRDCDFECADFSGIRLVNVQFIDCKNMDTVLTTDAWLTKVSFLGENMTSLTEPEEMKVKVGSWRYKDSETNFGDKD